MKKTAGLFGAALIILSLAACSGGSGDTGKVSSTEAAVEAAPTWLLTPGQLKICIDPTYPPMEFFSDGTSGDIIGFDADAAKALAAYWGISPTFVETAFDGLMPALQAKRCDVLWSALFTSDARLEVADAAKYFNTGPQVLINVKNKDKIKVANDLCGKTVAAHNGGPNAATAKALGDKCVKEGRSGITVAEYPKSAETVLAVTNGKADALVETDVASAYMVAQSSGQLVSVEGIFPAETQFGVFTIKGGPASEPVAKAVKALISNGTLADIATEYGLDPDRLVKG